MNKLSIFDYREEYVHVFGNTENDISEFLEKNKTFFYNLNILIIRTGLDLTFHFRRNYITLQHVLEAVKEANEPAPISLEDSSIGTFPIDSSSNPLRTPPRPLPLLPISPLTPPSAERRAPESVMLPPPVDNNPNLSCHWKEDKSGFSISGPSTKVIRKNARIPTVIRTARDAQEENEPLRKKPRHVP